MKWHKAHHDASMTFKIALTLIGVMLLVASGAVYYVVKVTGEQSSQEFDRRLKNQLTAILTLMDETPPADRPRLLPAINTPLFSVELQDTARGFVPPSGEARRVFNEMSEDILAPLKDRTVRVHVPDWDESVSPVADTRIAVKIEGGQWLVFGIPSYITHTIWKTGEVLTALVWVIVFIALIIVAAKRLSRPLRRFTEAAERLGRDLNAPPMSEHGGPELKRAARSFNAMQVRLQAYLEDRTLMLAAISHDLRSYLTRLRLRIEFLDGDERDKAVRDVEDMERILNDTLDFARDDAAKEDRVETDLTGFVADRVARFADAGQAARFDGGTGAKIEVRPVALARALDNLIDNALHHGGAASVSLEGAAITVRDPGPGIPESEWEKVFQPFYRLDEARTLGAGGSGLGLAIARSIARSHGGDVTFVRDNQGFAVRLDLAA